MGSKYFLYIKAETGYCFCFQHRRFILMHLKTSIDMEEKFQDCTEILTCQKYIASFSFFLFGILFLGFPVRMARAGWIASHGNHIVVCDFLVMGQALLGEQGDVDSNSKKDEFISSCSGIILFLSLFSSISTVDCVEYQPKFETSNRMKWSQLGPLQKLFRRYLH